MINILLPLGHFGVPLLPFLCLVSSILDLLYIKPWLLPFGLTFTVALECGSLYFISLIPFVSFKALYICIFYLFCFNNSIFPREWGDILPLCHDLAWNGTHSKHSVPTCVLNKFRQCLNSFLLNSPSPISITFFMISLLSLSLSGVSF